MITKNQQSTFIFLSDLSVYWFGLNSRSLQATVEMYIKQGL